MGKLKCWKKLSEKNNKFYVGTINVYMHKKEEKGVSVQKSIGGGKEKFVVYYGDRSNAMSKGFTKKPNALKFANKYMKKHDKC